MVIAWHIVEGLQRVFIFLGFHGHGATRRDVMDVVYSDDADLDVPILRGTMKLDYFLLPTKYIYIGNTRYVFGFDTDHLLKMSADIITSTGKQVFGKVQKAFVACHANDGYSGGPITDYEDHMKGMVVGGRGQNMLSTTFIPSTSIHTVVYNILLHRGKFGFFLCIVLPTQTISTNYNIYPIS